LDGCLANPKPLAVLGGQAIDIRFIEISETMVHDFFDARKSCREWQGGIHMIGLFARVFAAKSKRALCQRKARLLHAGN